MKKIITELLKLIFKNFKSSTPNASLAGVGVALLMDSMGMGIPGLSIDSVQGILGALVAGSGLRGLFRKG